MNTANNCAPMTHACFKAALLFCFILLSCGLKSARPYRQLVSITATKSNIESADAARGNVVIAGDSRLASTYGKASLGKSPLELADILVTDPPYCLLNRRRTGGDLRDPKTRKKKIDESDTVTRFENLKEYKVFTKEWLKPCIDYGLKADAGECDTQLLST